MKLINPPVVRRLAGHKFNIPMGICVFTGICQAIGNLPRSDKLYTAVFTDLSESGKYVRKTVKKNSPEVWVKVSRQLYHMGYSLPEMNEAVSGEFPTALVQAYEATDIE